MLKSISFLSALFVLSQAQAYHYGMAGCGLGSLAFKDQPGMIQVAAATVNNIVSPQTSAITSGTSGCYDGGSSAAKIDYIETNKVSLKEDAARGQGETLEGLMTLLGCKEPTIKNELKNNSQTIFGQDDAQGILKAIQSNSSMQKSCVTLG